jgi:hypothetical protein
MDQGSLAVPGNSVAVSESFEEMGQLDPPERATITLCLWLDPPVNEQFYL